MNSENKALENESEFEFTPEEKKKIKEEGTALFFVKDRSLSNFLTWTLLTCNVVMIVVHFLAMFNVKHKYSLSGNLELNLAFLTIYLWPLVLTLLWSVRMKKYMNILGMIIVTFISILSQMALMFEGISLGFTIGIVAILAIVLFLISVFMEKYMNGVNESLINRESETDAELIEGFLKQRKEEIMASDTLSDFEKGKQINQIEQQLKGLEATKNNKLDSIAPALKYEEKSNYFGYILAEFITFIIAEMAFHPVFFGIMQLGQLRFHGIPSDVKVAFLGAINILVFFLIVLIWRVLGSKTVKSIYGVAVGIFVAGLLTVMINTVYPWVFSVIYVAGVLMVALIISLIFEKNSEKEEEEYD